jgi:hypothetical protein
MEHSPEHGDVSAGAKRSRVLLSCGPCRNSKLKCDRAQPCGQCLKKGRPDGCAYAPRPEKEKPNKSMSSRLKRLEGMVRVMMEGNVAKQTPTPPDEGIQTPAKVVQRETGTTYVGATHFMAMLDDVSKQRFTNLKTPLSVAYSRKFITLHQFFYFYFLFFAVRLRFSNFPAFPF